jgi:hypothetical protein
MLKFLGAQVDSGQHMRTICRKTFLEFLSEGLHLICPQNSVQRAASRFRSIFRRKLEM